MDYKYLIIGGGVAGTTAAETIRQNDPEASLAIVSDESHPLYSRVMMSKPEYFTGEIPEEKIFLKQPDWYSRNKIDYLQGRTATALDTASKKLTLDNDDVFGYEKLLLAVGSIPRSWDVPGGGKKGVFSLRRFDDYKKIKAHIPRVKNAVAIGGGFISFEMCEIMKRLGLSITLVLRENYYWEPVFDKESGEMAEQAMEKTGVKIIKNAEVKEALGNEEVNGVILNNGANIPCEMIMVSIGNFCALDFVRAAGIEVSRGIVADEYLRTSAPDVWAAGDAADFADIVLEEQIELGNWANASAQGRTAGLNMTGQTQPFKLVSSCNAYGFGMVITFIGDVRPEKGKKTIMRKSADGKSIIQLFSRFGELIGATSIYGAGNNADELATITALIEKDVKIAGLEGKLSDPFFDLKALLTGQ